MPKSYRNEVILATDSLKTINHVTAITGINPAEVSQTLRDTDVPKTFFDRVKYVVGELRSRAVAAVDIGAEAARDQDSAYQTLRRTRLQAEKLEFELKVKQGEYVALADIQRDIAQVAVVAAKNLDALLPKIQMLIPDLPAHVSDEIEEVIASCRNGIADIKLEE